MTEQEYDVLIVGGGINGCGIARDAAGRGFKVALVEQDDLASGTSSAATKLIHGGLRYLEHYEFRLVREALMERETLWAMAPHIIHPLRFVLPHHKGLRPAWLLRLGLFLYDHLGGRNRLAGTRSVDLKTEPYGDALAGGCERGFEYSDCWVDDARLVVLNAVDAAARGAAIHTLTRFERAERAGDLWQTHVTDVATGKERVLRARMIVNAAGPWVDRVAGHIVHERFGAGAASIRMVQGSHLVVDKLFDHDRAYIFQNGDGRIIFAIPYEGDYTLIGTTDRDYEGDPADAGISAEETDYLLAAANQYFAAPITREQVVWSFSGIRPLFDETNGQAQAASRDYTLRTTQIEGLPLLNVFGGKLTTYRRLAQHALDEIEAVLGARGPQWTAGALLPGGDIGDDRDPFIAKAVAHYSWLPPAVVRRLACAYGSRISALLEGASSPADLGLLFGAGLYQREVDFLVRTEWARTAEDIVRRRTKLILKLSEAEIAALDAYLASSESKAQMLELQT